MRQGAWVDHDPGGARPFLLQEVDELPFVVALEGLDLQPKGARLGADDFVQVVEGSRAVDVRLALAKQVEVRSVDDDDLFHASDLVTTRRTRAPGTLWPVSACPIRRGITHATLPRLAFLSKAIAAMTRSGSACGGRSGRPRDSRSSSCDSTRRLRTRSSEAPMRAATRMPKATARPWLTRSAVAASSAWPAVCP